MFYILEHFYNALQASDSIRAKHSPLGNEASPGVGGRVMTNLPWQSCAGPFVSGDWDCGLRTHTVLGLHHSSTSINVLRDFLAPWCLLWIPGLKSPWNVVNAYGWHQGMVSCHENRLRKPDCNQIRPHFPGLSISDNLEVWSQKLMLPLEALPDTPCLLTLF